MVSFNKAVGLDLDLSNPDQWSRKVLDAVIENAEFTLNKNEFEAFPNVSKLGLVASLESDSGYENVEIIVDNGIISVFSEYEGNHWGIDFNQGDEYDDGDRVF